MSFQSLSERLAALQASNTQLSSLINRLANIKFQPGSVPLGDGDDNVKTELASEITQTIKDQEEDLDLLQEEVIDLNGGRVGSELDIQKRGLALSVMRTIAELKQLVVAFRKAQIAARRSLETAQNQERKLLLQSYLYPESESTSKQSKQSRQKPGRRSVNSSQLSQEDKTISASTDVTLALRRTHGMMASELSRSQFAHDTLRESTQALAELGETYSVLDTMLSSSKNLLGTLLRSQKSDTWYLETAFYVLAATIAWLLWRRLLYGPTWWLVWLPLKMVFKAWVSVFTALGILGRSGSDVNVSSMVGSETGLGGSLISPTVVFSGSTSVVGSGGGASIRETDAPDGQESVSEQVGRIIDESQVQAGEGGQENGGNTEEIPQDQKNPKKRMWEEEKQAPKEQERRKKDEL